MRTVKPLALVVIATVLLTSLVVLIHLPRPSFVDKAPEEAPSIDISSLVFVGSAAGLPGEVVSNVEARSGRIASQVSDLPDLAPLIETVDASSIVIFQSEWLVGKVNQTALLDFLRAILPTEAKIVALGSSTALLFETLDRVTDVFAEGRNPGYDNPPVVGYKLRGATAPDGMMYQGASILIAHPYLENATSAVDSILSWR